MKKKVSKVATKKATEIKKDPLLEDVEELEEETEETDGVGETEGTSQEEAFDPTKAVAQPKQAAQSGRVLTELEKEALRHVQDLARFKKEIEAAPKTKFMVPLDPGEKPGAVQVVSLNGVAFTIKKGAMVTIPEPIAEILMEKYAIEAEAGSHMLIGRDEKTETALG